MTNYPVTEFATYRPKGSVNAIPLAFEALFFTYRKDSWGPGNQTAELGDYILQGEDGDVYTCNKAVFESTYARRPDGRYAKTAIITAAVANEDFELRTLEGTAHVRKEWYVVRNPGGDMYAMPFDKFESRYVPVT